MHGKLSALLGGHGLYSLSLCPFTQYNLPCFISMTLFPIFSPIPDILWAYALFVVPNLVIHWWLPENKQTKIFPVFSNTLVFWRENHILRSYLCVVHINCTPLYNIMMLTCKIVVFLLLYLSLFSSRIWHRNDLSERNHCDSSGF